MTGVGLGRDGAEAAGLEVLEGLDELGAGVHHERPVGGHRLADGLAAQDQDVELLVAALLGAGGLDGEHVAELASGDGMEVRFRDGLGRLAQLPGSNFYRRIRDKFGRLAH